MIDVQFRRKCIYDTNVTKYMVLVRDEVEAGDEKIREMEQQLQDLGLYDTDFSLGDLVDDDDEVGSTNNTPPKKVKLQEFPVVEGEESVTEYVGQYKKACLNRKALYKTTRERLEKDKAVGYQPLSQSSSIDFATAVYVLSFAPPRFHV